MSKRMVAMLREEIKHLKADIEERKLEEQAWRRHITDLRYRHDFMIGELSDLSQKLVLRPSWYDSSKNQWSEAMAFSAATALSKVAKLPLREGP